MHITCKFEAFSYPGNHPHPHLPHHYNHSLLQTLDWPHHQLLAWVVCKMHDVGKRNRQQSHATSHKIIVQSDTQRVQMIKVGLPQSDI